MCARQTTALWFRVNTSLTSKSPNKVCRKARLVSSTNSLTRNLKRRTALRTLQHAPFIRTICGSWKRARPYVSDCRETKMARTGGKRHLDEADAREYNATANDVMREEHFRRGRKSARENDLLTRNRLPQPWHSRKPLQPRYPVIRATSVV